MFQNICSRKTQHQSKSLLKVNLMVSVFSVWKTILNLAMLTLYSILDSLYHLNSSHITFRCPVSCIGLTLVTAAGIQYSKLKCTFRQLRFLLPLKCQMLSQYFGDLGLLMRKTTVLSETICENKIIASPGKCVVMTAFAECFFAKRKTKCDTKFLFATTIL